MVVEDEGAINPEKAMEPLRYRKLANPRKAVDPDEGTGRTLNAIRGGDRSG